MKQNIEKNSFIKRNDLDETNYFNTLIENAINQGILSLDIVSDIQLQCLELLKIQIDKYNGLYSSSIPKDIANKISDSNLYTIGLYLKKFTPDEAIKILQNENIIGLYNKGKKLINRKLNISRVLYEKVLLNKLNINNDTYNATIQGGIKGFFKIYNPNFEANNIKITADYPLYNNLIAKTTGIEFIELYLEYLNYENEFCNMFDDIKIKSLLYSYSSDFLNLNINIFQIVLTEVIGCKLANKNIKNLTLMNEDLYAIYLLFDNKNKDEIYSIIFKAFNSISMELLNNNLYLQNYIEKGLYNLQSEIYNNFQLNTLDKTFILNNYIS